MLVQEEIAYRDSIMKKAYNKQKITPEERIWLITHPLYHLTLGAPFLSEDILKVSPNVLYTVKIKQELVMCENMPVPIIGVPPHKKGYIHMNSLEKPVKILGLIFDGISEPIEVKLKTPDGFVSIGYEYTYYDELQHITVCQKSNSHLGFAMKKEILSDNKILYHCKLPNDKESNCFEKYVFSIEFNQNLSGAGSMIDG